MGMNSGSDTHFVKPRGAPTFFPSRVLSHPTVTNQSAINGKSPPFPHPTQRFGIKHLSSWVKKQINMPWGSPLRFVVFFRAEYFRQLLKPVT
ncbi:hypothetical protein ACJIZ3_013344 [Penstemon smallii]|uniref:Uncharacterized protein n=1 Tax=Penstemon smallii TaxID=265156 RepID=A0ABD3UPK5_9LAMI